VNLPTKLNRFQLGKRNKCDIADQSELWDMMQQDASELIKEGENRIIKSKFTPWFDAMIISSAGLYLINYNSRNELTLH
jgi:hypothetical protein